MKKYILSLLGIVSCFNMVQAADNNLRAFAANNIRQMASLGSNEHVNADKGAIGTVPGEQEEKLSDDQTQIVDEIKNVVIDANIQFTWMLIIKAYKKETEKYDLSTRTMKRKQEGLTVPEALLDMSYKNRDMPSHRVYIKALLLDKQHAERVSAYLTGFMRAKNYMHESWFPWQDVSYPEKQE